MREGKRQINIGRSLAGGMRALLLLSAFLVRSEVGAQTPDKSGVKPSIISLPSGPGSIEGLGESFEPQLNTGSSTYSVGLEFPPGRAGLQPSLSLSYNSSLGNSMVGIGWNLSLPEIRRQTDKGFPQYNSKDTFTFQGEELVPLSDGTFRCENERGFQRFRRLDADDDGRFDSWEMTERNGTRHYFGRFRGKDDRWSAVAHPGVSSADLAPFDRTFCWGLDQSIDLHGNRIEYEYVSPDGTNKLFPSRITYGHSDSNAHEVILAYEDRLDAFDDYRPTFSERIDRRLAEISIYTDGALVRSYRLGYEYLESEDYSDSVPLPVEERIARERALDLGVSVLKRVTQFDREVDSGNHLPPLVFFYSFLRDDPGGAQIREVRTASGGGLPSLDLADPSGRTQLADVDGDGLPDLFSTDAFTGAQKVVFNEGLSANGNLRFSDAVQVSRDSGIDLSLASTSMTDFDADGIVDIVRISPVGAGQTRIDRFQNLNRLDLRSAHPIGFEPFPSALPEFIDNAPAWLGFGNPEVSQMDVNFDKASDFVRGRSQLAGLVLEGVYRGSEGEWRQFQTQTSIPGSYTLDRPVAGDDVSIHLADMNGDRLLDFVALERIGSGIGATLRARYWPYCSLGQWADARTAMELSAGDVFQIDNADLRDFFLQDFTGDGLADILRLDGSGEASRLTLRVNVAGTAWSQPITKTGLPSYRPIRDGSGTTTFRTADLNGNGSTDLIWRNKGLGDDTFQWLDLMPDAGKPNLLTRIDNSIGKITEIEYGNAHEDYVRARDAGHPWTTKIPFANQVVRQIRTSSGYDLNGDGKEDIYVSEFRYRDGFYDGFEKEFRGFAFAERIDFGDDFLWDENLGVLGAAEDWNHGVTPTRQVSGPTLVTRYRFHTGAADQQDNDDPPLDNPLGGFIDELTDTGGREEEPLKGRQFLEEKVDSWLLHNGDMENQFDAASAKAAASGDLYASITDDAYVYTRARQFWGVRRLYRPTEPLATRADQNADGALEALGEQVQVPAGRLIPIHVPDGVGKSVSYSFVEKIETDIIEANPLLADALEYDKRDPVQTRTEFDYDDYGNPILERDSGILDEAYDDERVVTTTYALGGEALDRWIINRPDTIETTDEAGAFVNRTKHYYDGAPFTGLESGVMGSRALLHRVEKFIDRSKAVDEGRSRYDAYGNVVEMRDPNFGTEFAASGGNRRVIEYDPVFHTYPVREIISIGDGKPDLVMEAGYDFGFGVVTRSTDFNQNFTIYEYDSFARLVAIVKPGDSSEYPTQIFEYQAFDPHRGLLYSYARNGDLDRGPGGSASNRVVTRVRETAGTDEVYTTAVYTDGMGKTIAEVGEGEESGTWIVSKAASYNLRGSESAIWLPYQVSSTGVPRFATFWPDGRPPESDGINPAVVHSEVFYDPVGREIKTLQPPESWGGERKETWTQILPFEKRLFDENDSDSESPYANTPLVHFEDGLGRLVTVHEVVRLTDQGEPGALTEWETRYTYDLNDKLEAITDSQENLKAMEYDGLARLTYMDDPDRGEMFYIYNDASNLIQTTDAKGQVIAYTYDGVNRIRSEDYLDEGQPHSLNHTFDPAKPMTDDNRPDVAYFYDHSTAELDFGDGTRGAGANPLGQLCYVWDLTGEEHFSYDARGRIEWQVKRIPDTILKNILVSWRTRYEYDSLDRVTRLIYPDGDRLTYGYNARNLLENVVGGPSGFIIKNIDYQPSAQLKQIVYGNGVTTTYEYDPRLRLRDLDTDSPVAGKLIHFGYTFDPANNITRIDDHRDLTGHPDAEKRKNTQVFQYDDLYRLNQVAYPALVSGSDGTIDYRYDRIGNMLKKESNIEHVENGLSVTHLGTMSYGGSLGATGRTGRGTSAAGPHALSAVSADGGRAYPYDANGNMTDIDGLLCSWDFKDRMVAAENDKMSARYHYDYTDRRIVKEVTPKDEAASTETTQYINKYFELRPGDPPVKYVWSGDTRVARITTVLDDSASKIQKLRLREGWNLTSLTLDGDTSALDPSSSSLLDAVAVWNVEMDSWNADGLDQIPSQTPFWIHANREAMFGLNGERAPPVSLEFNAGQPDWVVNTGDGPLEVDEFPIDASLWLWDGSDAGWKARFGAGAGAFVDKGPERIESGGVAYAIGESGGIIEPFPDRTIQVRYYHQDHLGSSSVMSDSEGGVIEEVANYPFGSVRSKYRFHGISEPYGFTQKESDVESRLHYFEARYLSSGLGRFTKVDPCLVVELHIVVGFPERLNIYSYCQNSPTLFVDPTGCSEKVATNLIESESVTLNVSGKAEVFNASAELSLEAGAGGSTATALSTEAEISLKADGSAEYCQKTKAGSFESKKRMNALKTKSNSITIAKHKYCKNLKTGKSKHSLTFFETSRTIKAESCADLGPVEMCANSKAEVSVKPFALKNNKSGPNFCASIKVEGNAGISLEGGGAGWNVKTEMSVKGNATMEICVKK